MPITKRAATLTSVVSTLILFAACEPAQRDADSNGSGATVTAEDTTAPDEPRAACAVPEPRGDPGTGVVAVYFACDSGMSGQLYPVKRRVPRDDNTAHAAIEEMLRGPTDAEKARGFSSLFSQSTAGMLRDVTLSPGGDTLLVDFSDFRPALAGSPNPRSFLPGGVMADITWTVFRQFPEVQVLRLAFDGSEREFWSWLEGKPAPPRAFTRADWERI